MPSSATSLIIRSQILPTLATYMSTTISKHLQPFYTFLSSYTPNPLTPTNLLNTWTLKIYTTLFSPFLPPTTTTTIHIFTCTHTCPTAPPTTTTTTTTTATPSTSSTTTHHPHPCLTCTLHLAQKKERLILAHYNPYRTYLTARLDSLIKQLYSVPWPRTHPREKELCEKIDEVVEERGEGDWRRRMEVRRVWGEVEGVWGRGVDGEGEWMGREIVGRCVEV
ncbi:MAG: hypothetical protein Q9186_002792 [Xanthomendoza sp. 1 TL-2023]